MAGVTKLRRYKGVLSFNYDLPADEKEYESMSNNEKLLHNEF